jgi:histidine phosphotransferase ChpT
MIAPELAAPHRAAPDPMAPDLTALVSARLCHDLISPMGAIGNGLELMQLAATPGAAELALVNDSLANALAKLRFYRIAFGPADPQGRLSLDEVEAITDAMYTGRFTVGWEAEVRDLPRSAVRLACLALLCLEKCLPMGGQVRAEVEPERIRLAVDGRRTAPPARLWEHLRDGAPLGELKPDGVQFALLRRALGETRHRIEMTVEESAAEIGIIAERPAELAEAPL